MNVFYDLLSLICSILMNHYCTSWPRTNTNTIVTHNHHQHANFWKGYRLCRRRRFVMQVFLGYQQTHLTLPIGEVGNQKLNSRSKAFPSWTFSTSLDEMYRDCILFLLFNPCISHTQGWWKHITNIVWCVLWKMYIFFISMAGNC